MNKKIFTILKFCIFFSLGIFLVWWSIQQIPQTEYEAFAKSLKTAKYWMIIPVFLILSASHVIRALRWKLLMEPMGYKPSLANTFFAVMIGYLANFALPRLGEILKCTILAKYEHIPAEKNIGTIVAERAFDVICLLLMFALALFLQYDVVIEAYYKMMDYSSSIKTNESQSAFNIKMIFALAFVVFIAWMTIAKKWQIIFTKTKVIIKGIIEGLLSALKLKQKNLFIFYSILIWILYLAGTWIGLYATTGTGVGLPAAVSCLAFASIGMILTPGGIGAYAILIAKVLEINNVPYALGLANGTLQWFAQFAIIVVVGFICVILLPLYNKNIVASTKS
ncbi:MAG: flippase-like domain-containing protein [Chitinophagaceae bacterium]|nr:flippase-like domain-containing protein [Chitinophagaceae bacterium]